MNAIHQSLLLKHILYTCFCKALLRKRFDVCVSTYIYIFFFNCLIRVIYLITLSCFLNGYCHYYVLKYFYPTFVCYCAWVFCMCVNCILKRCYINNNLIEGYRLPYGITMKTHFRFLPKPLYLRVCMSSNSAVL